MYLILILVLVLLVFGGLPVAPWGGWHGYGYWPSGLGFVLVLVLVILLLSGRL